MKQFQDIQQKFDNLEHNDFTEFYIDYIKSNTYYNSKALAGWFMHKILNVEHDNKRSFHIIKCSIIQKLRFFNVRMIKLKIIEKYNRRTYKIVNGKMFSKNDLSKILSNKFRFNEYLKYLNSR